MQNNDLILKAIILVGGYGTRLRPLTFSKPKPLIEFCNKPTLMHQIEALVNVGVNEVVLAINYQPEKLQAFIKETEIKFNIKIKCSKEDSPLGTAGPIGLARDLYFNKDVCKENIDYIFVFNADITCSYPLKKLLNFHIEKKAEGTIYTTKVEDPSKYGVIVSDKATNKIIEFIEKPKEYISNDINAGLYVFSYSFLDRIETKQYSIEREVFPKLAKEGKLYSLPLEGFWMDIGQPKDFLKGSMFYLENLSKDKLFSNNNSNFKINGNVLVDETCQIEEDCVLGPNVVLGKNVKINKGTRIKNSIVLDNTIIKEYSYIDGSIIGWNNKVGKWVRITGLSITGEDVSISDELSVDSSIIMPNLSIKSNLTPNSKVIF